MAARKKLNQSYGCPPEPWTSVDAKLLWNIANISAAQISILGGITGPAMAPVGACASFGVCLKLADERHPPRRRRRRWSSAPPTARRTRWSSPRSSTRACSPPTARSRKPLTGMRGTHVAGGSCVWIVGDADYLMAQGMKPLGLEILGVGTQLRRRPHHHAVGGRAAQRHPASAARGWRHAGRRHRVGHARDGDARRLDRAAHRAVGASPRRRRSRRARAPSVTAWRCAAAGS